MLPAQVNEIHNNEEKQEISWIIRATKLTKFIRQHQTKTIFTRTNQ